MEKPWLQLIAAQLEKADLPWEVLRVPIDCDDDLNQVRAICVLEGKEDVNSTE